MMGRCLALLIAACALNPPPALAESGFPVKVLRADCDPAVDADATVRKTDLALCYVYLRGLIEGVEVSRSESTHMFYCSGRMPDIEEVRLLFLAAAKSLEIKRALDLDSSASGIVLASLMIRYPCSHS